MNNDKPILFVMGVSGCGKSTVGQLLATNLNLEFFDGDDYHPKENVQKMEKGNPLNDDDRQGWLERLNVLANENKEEGAVIACSALKTTYRSLLQKGIVSDLHYIYLKGSFEEVSERLRQRKGHFMPAELLRSQFEALEVPKEAIVVSIANTPEGIVSAILKKLNL